MNNCILCNNTGKNRKYFFKNKPLCDTDYIAYLEFLIQGTNGQVTTEAADDAYRHLEISLKPEAPKPAPKPYNNKPCSIRMGM
jgi:hypothetical protein